MLRCRRVWPVVLWLALVFLSLWHTAEGEDTPQTITSLGVGDEKKLDPKNAAVKCLGNGVLRIESAGGVENASVTFGVGKAYDRRDWRKFGGIALDVKNPSDEPVIVGIATADGNRKHRAGSTRLYGRERTTVALLFESSIPGMRGAPVPLPPASLDTPTLKVPIRINKRAFS